MKELSEKLSVLRKRAGMIEFKSKEYQYLLNDKNEIIEIKLKKSGASEKIIENFMILANEIVGSHFFNLSLPAIYRVHEKPDLEKINNLFLELNKLKINTPRINHLTPLALQSFLEEVKDHPLSDYINDLLLKSMAKAKYSEINKGHYGLALNNYSHFTAPIRRYSDLFLHRLIKELILYPRELNKKINHYQTILKAICQQASLMEVKAETISREVDKYMVTKYMQNFLNEEFEGVITGMIKSGIFVTVKDGIEGFIPFRLLNSYYSFDEKTLTAINETTKKTYQLSNRISVKLVEVNVSLRQITFVLVDK
jgi:ribonuclease R